MTKHVQSHWNAVYTTKGEQEVSWFEALPAVSLRMLLDAGLTADTCVLDVGGGDSRLVDALVARGLDCVAVLDIAGSALDRARARLGRMARTPIWIEADVSSDWSVKPMDIWHDRAVFHFLVTADERMHYREHLWNTLKVGGTAVVATFAPDGPQQCSGLPVMRYSADTLSAEMGSRLTLIETVRHLHTTPWGATQSFQYSRFLRVS